MHYQGKPGLKALEPEDGRLMYSVPELATRYGVHPATIYREIKAGRLKALRLGAKGGAVRVPVASVAEYEALATITADDLVEVA